MSPFYWLLAKGINDDTQSFETFLFVSDLSITRDIIILAQKVCFVRELRELPRSNAFP